MFYAKFDFEYSRYQLLVFNCYLVVPSIFHLIIAIISFFKLSCIPVIIYYLFLVFFLDTYVHAHTRGSSSMRQHLCGMASNLWMFSIWLLRSFYDPCWLLEPLICWVLGNHNRHSSIMIFLAAGSHDFDALYYRNYHAV